MRNISAVLNTTYLALLILSVPAICGFGFVVNHKIWQAYRLVHDHAPRLGFQWFAVQFQLPRFSRSMARYIDFSTSLPPEIAARLDRVRKDMNAWIIGCVCWIAFVFLFGALSAYVRRHVL